MAIDPDCSLRRQKLYQSMTANEAVLLCTSPQYLRNGDVYFGFRPHSDFLYLTGFDEMEAFAVLLPDGKGSGEYILFCRSPDPKRDCWEGPCIGQERACSVYGADRAYGIADIDSVLPALLAERSRWWLAVDHYPLWQERVQAWRKALQEDAGHAITTAALGEHVHPMRRIKSQSEQRLMRKAVSISVDAHLAVMAQCRPGLRESDMVGVLWQRMLAGGAAYMAYSHIVAAGANACTLHYTRNSDPLVDGQLLLVDAGAEYQGYAGDLTRTLPINGRFTADQQAIYELVLAAQLAVIAAMRPGVRWCSLQDIAVRVLVEGLKDLAILTGDVDELIAAKAYLPMYMHGIGHHLGLDVHDVGGYGEDHGMVLQPGMVLTVEPGLYLSPDLCPMLERWHHIGVRIEDDVLVTEDGCIVLSEALPKQVDDVHAQMKVA